MSIDVNKITKAFDENQFAWFSPGRGKYPHGFDTCLLTGKKGLTTLQEITHTATHVPVAAAGLLAYSETPGKDEQHRLQHAFIPVPPVDFFQVEKNEILSGDVGGHEPYQIKHPVQLQPVINRSTYITQVNHLKKHILRGDIYEVNFCMEFRAENVQLDVVPFFLKLYSFTKAPFSCLYKSGTRYIFCASPERYLQKNGAHILSQPIKGTIHRGSNANEDEVLKKQLRESTKEQSENVMITDLVRNDLSRVAAKGSVKVDELFGIYTFETVHQMISTISCDLREGLTLTDVWMATFPMGSMTGAPKISAMKLIRNYEAMERGAYSGSLGYIKSNGDADFNVVIRSIVYDASTGRLSFSVGSAITHYSHTGNEYDECMLKAQALIKSLQ